MKTNSRFGFVPVLVVLLSVASASSHAAPVGRTAWTPLSGQSAQPLAWQGPSASPYLLLPGRFLRGIAFDSGALWTLHSEQGVSDVVRISKFDAVTGALLLESGDLPWNGRGITVGASSLWIVDALAGQIDRVDPVTLEVLESFRTPGSEPNGIAFDGLDLWLTDPYSQRIYELALDGQIVGQFPIPDAYRNGLEWESNGMWTNTANQEVSHYLMDGMIDEARALSGLPPEAQIYDIAIGNGVAYVTAGDRIYKQRW